MNLLGPLKLILDCVVYIIYLDMMHVYEAVWLQELLKSGREFNQDSNMNILGSKTLKLNRVGLRLLCRYNFENNR